MLEIWINGKFHDESEESCPRLVPIDRRKTVQLDGFKNTRKLEVGIMISCLMTTSDKMGHNPQAPGPAKKQAHSC